MFAAKGIFLAVSTSVGHYKKDENELTLHVAKREIEHKSVSSSTGLHHK